MKAQFKYSRTTIDGKHFPPGIHELENKMLDHWFFQALVQAQHIVVLDEPEFSPPAPAALMEEKEQEEVKEKPVKKKKEKSS